MSRSSRRHWLRAGAALATAGLLPLPGCSNEPVTRHAGEAFGAPAELVLWGPDEGTAQALADGVWRFLAEFDRAWRAGQGEAAARVASALAGGAALPGDAGRAGGAGLAPLPAPAPGADADIVWRGMGLDAAAGQLRLPDGAGALLTLGEHLLALGERGLRPWHVGIPDPVGGQPLAGLDLYAGERLVTVASVARYRQASDDSAATVPPGTGAGDCASCSVVVRGALAARAARLASLLYASARADWPARAAAAGAQNVLWVGRDGSLEADLLMGKRAEAHDPRRPLRMRSGS